MGREPLIAAVPQGGARTALSLSPAVRGSGEMNRRWLVLTACATIAAVVGFQQAEPLEELRKYGTLHRGVG